MLCGAARNTGTFSGADLRAVWSMAMNEMPHSCAYGSRLLALHSRDGDWEIFRSATVPDSHRESNFCRRSVTLALDGLLSATRDRAATRRRVAAARGCRFQVRAGALPPA